MRAILAELIDIAQRTGRFTVVEATNLYIRLWVIVGLAFAACGVAFWMNAFLGWKAPSLMLAIVFAVAALFLWAKPLYILIVAGAGLAAKVATHAAVEVEKALKEYLNFLKWFLVVGTTFLFITGTISFKQHPAAVLVMIVAVGIMWIFTWMWPHIFVGIWGRRLIYAYAVVMIGVSLGSLVPGPVWVKYTSWDPATAKPTGTEESLYRLTRARQDIADADRAKELERITKKIESREALTQAEEKFIVEAERSQSNESKQAKGTGVLTMDAGRKSERIKAPVGYAVYFPDSTGTFDAYYGYADGVEVNTRDEMPFDKRGVEIMYSYVLDTSGRSNRATYEFVRQK